MSQGSESGLFNEDRGAQSIVRKKNTITENIQNALFLWTSFRMATPCSLMLTSKDSLTETIGILKPWLFVKSLLLSFCAKTKLNNRIARVSF